jgi:hypothetical protein
VAAQLRAASAGVTDPLHPWGAYLLGAGPSLVHVGSYAPIITDSDSAWIDVSTDFVRRNGIGLLQDNQEVLLPHLTLGPLIALDGYRAANLFVIACGALFLSLAAVLAYQLTRRAVVAGATVAALLAMPEIVNRAERLPLYSLTFALVYGAGWLLHRAMSEDGRPWWLPVAAGALLVLGFEAHSTGQLALALPLLLLLAHPERRAIRPVVVSGLTVAILAIPRVWLNLSEGGLTAFRSNRTDWEVTGGYLTMINQDFYGQAAGVSPPRYALVVPTLVRQAFGEATTALLALFVVIAFVYGTRRGRRFVIGTAGFFVAALSIAGPGTYARYVTPLALGFALVGGIGLAKALDGDRTTRLLARSSMVILAVLATVELRESIQLTRLRQEAVYAGALPALAELADDGTAVLGIRAHELVWTDPTARTEFARTMSEQDFVTYLTWPSDDEVVDLMHRLDAGWIMLHSDPTLEIDYHDTWLFPTYGQHVRHVEMVATSPDFCHVAAINGYHLYRLGACAPGEPSGKFAPDPGSLPYEEPVEEPAPVDDADAPDDVSEPGVPPTTDTTLDPQDPAEEETTP